jgi:protein SERAC1
LGGLVVKQALVTAKLNGSYGTIIKSTCGMVFFGTPHRGGHGATVAKHAARALSVFTGQPSNTLLSALEKKSFSSESLTQHFQMISEDFMVLSFFEKRKKRLK